MQIAEALKPSLPPSLTASIPLMGCPANQREASAHPVLAHVDGWPITTPNLDVTVADTVSRARARSGFSLFTLNLDHLVKLRQSQAFRNAYRQAEIITADGAPIAWLSRKQSIGVERTTGADLLIPLISAAAYNDLPVYLLGTTDAVLERTAFALSRQTRGRIKFAGLHAPSANFDPYGPEGDAAIERIKASGAAVCFVALGAPKQEIFSARAVEHGARCGFICIGAALDFVAGSQIRAPRIFQRTGLEWAWRLATNPRRLASRYARCAHLLFDVAVWRPLRQQFAIGSRLP